jgi:hypothetical protein
MKKQILFFAILIFLIIGKLRSQTVAGNIPAGMQSFDPAFSMSVSQNNTEIKDSLDIDCDGNIDVIFKLYKGMTVVDGANTLEMYIYNQDYDFCSYPGNWADIMQFYSLNDTLICSGQSNWNNDTIMLGNYGCMLCSENFTINNKYIAYSKNSTEYGWIRLSHNLVDMGNSSAPITLTVHEIATDCLPNGIEITEVNDLKIATIDENTLNILGLEQAMYYSLISMDGRTVLQGRTDSVIDISMLTKGFWILKFDNSPEAMKFIKL